MAVGWFRAAGSMAHIQLRSILWDLTKNIGKQELTSTNLLFYFFCLYLGGHVFIITVSFHVDRWAHG
jgi:vacuolar-type H+-ATPase subunit I/STV1